MKRKKQQTNKKAQQQWIWFGVSVNTYIHHLLIAHIVNMRVFHFSLFEIPSYISGMMNIVYPLPILSLIFEFKTKLHSGNCLIFFHLAMRYAFHFTSVYCCCLFGSLCDCILCLMLLLYYYCYNPFLFSDFFLLLVRWAWAPHTHTALISIYEKSIHSIKTIHFGSKWKKYMKKWKIHWKTNNSAWNSPFQQSGTRMLRHRFLFFSYLHFNSYNDQVHACIFSHNLIITLIYYYFVRFDSWGLKKNYFSFHLYENDGVNVQKEKKRELIKIIYEKYDVWMPWIPESIPSSRKK